MHFQNGLKNSIGFFRRYLLWGKNCDVALDLLVYYKIPAGYFADGFDKGLNVDIIKIHSYVGRAMTS